MRAALALVAVVASTGSLPKAGMLVPGQSLGGVRLGETAAQTRAALGGFYGRCDGCARTTWYFTYGKWTRTGLAVELQGGRVAALYTLWQPPGWHTAAGLRLGAVEGQVTSLAGPVVPVACAGYTRPRPRRARHADRVLRRRREAVGLRADARARESVPHVISIDDVRAAAATLAGVANRTPVFTSRTLDERVGARVFLKAECFQRGGAFKFRGAYTKISSLPADVRARGVLAYSSGNHAQAVAIAARLHGTTATIVMPEDTPPAKLEATRGYGAEIVSYDRWTEDREEIGARLADERGLALVRPYDDPLVMAGQGTTALELFEDVPDIDVLVVPVGGGGLIAGCATAAKALRPGVRVVGVEPETGNDTRAVARSRRARSHRRAAHDRGRPAGVVAGRADIRGEPPPRRRDRDGHGRRHPRRDGVPLRPAQARDGAERRSRRRGAPHRAVAAPGASVGVVISGGNVGVARFAGLLGRD